MPITANSMIERALRIARVLGKGETLDSDEAADGLESLNAMLDSWQLDRLFVPAIVDETFTWAGGAASRTVGAAGNFVTTRPTKVDESSYFTSNSIDYPLRLIDSDAYSAIQVKATSSTFPRWLYVDYTSLALVTLYAFEVPSAAITFHMRSWKMLQQFTSLTDVLNMQPGAQRAIEYSLAEEVAPEYGKEVSKKTEQIAASARAALKRSNAPSPVMATEVGYMTGGNTRTNNVYAGD